MISHLLGRMENRSAIFVGTGGGCAYALGSGNYRADSARNFLQMRAFAVALSATLCFDILGQFFTISDGPQCEI